MADCKLGWGPTQISVHITFVPPQCLVDLMGMVDGISDKLEEVSKLAAKTTGEAIAEEKRAKEEKVASGEEPPELV